MTSDLSTAAMDPVTLKGIIEEDYFNNENDLLDMLPVAVYTCDATGVIRKYNEQAVKLWGRRPEPGDKDERFCGSFKLYCPNGDPLPHSETPAAACLLDGMARKDQQVIIERPDLSRILVRTNIVPIKNNMGQVTGMINCFEDITRQRETEHKFSEKREGLQEYVENAAIGIHWVDANGIIIWANNAELEMLGYPREEYIGRHISEFHIKSQVIQDILNRLGRNETLSKYEAVLRCKNGSEKIVSINSNVFRDSEGKFVHTRCFTTDITPEKNLLSSLKQSEEGFRQLMQSLPVAIYTTNNEGLVTMYNNAAVDLWGREPVIGVDKWCGSWKIYKTDGGELPLDTCPMAITLREGRSVNGHEIIVERPDGSRRHVMPHPKPVFDNAGNMTGAVNMLLDITELKLTESILLENEKQLRSLAASLEKRIEERTADIRLKNEELRRSEERFHKMTDEVEDYAILLMDKSGIIQNWNRGAQKIKGYNEEEIVGRHIRVFYMPEDQNRELPEQLIAQAARDGKALHEGWRVRKDGSVFWGSTVITALHDTGNNVIGFSKVTRDLTERKIAEDKIRQYTAELEFQNRELEQFAYAAAHDMKEPLRKVRFYSNLVFESSGNLLPAKERDYLGRTIRAAARMQTLIDDLLTYSKASRQEPDFKKVDLGQTIAEILVSHSDTIREINAEVETGSLPIIDGVTFQLMQLFDNLIGNALKYRHTGRQLHIRIFSEKVLLPVEGSESASEQEEYYKVTIADNGTGFDSQYAEKVFDLFQRLHDKINYTGTGIGLALCRRIVQIHNGFITAQGEEDKGASFMVYFPVGNTV